MSSPFDTVSSYFYAKDGNRPFLMRHVFSENAELEMVVNTDAISFPSNATGLDAIEDILCRSFSNDFENVYSFCMSRPTSQSRRHFPCHWLVGMSGKNNGPIRIGCGRYDWYFKSDDKCLVERLKITIDEMKVFPQNHYDPVMSWLIGLPYPWCTPNEVIAQMPEIEGLEIIKSYLHQSANSS